MIQMKYDGVFHQLEDGKVKQFYPDLKSVLEDQKEATKIVEFIGADNYGKDDEYMLNKDPENDNITDKQITQLFWVLTRKLNGELDKKQVYFFFVASHGIDKVSQQHIVLNQFNKSDEFCKLVNVEDKIRNLS